MFHFFMSFPANITIEEELEHTLIHYLCVGSMTHSKVLEMLRSEGKQASRVMENLSMTSKLIKIGFDF